MEVMKVLSVSSLSADHTTLETILSRSTEFLSSDSQWVLRQANSVSDAIEILQRGRMPIVISDVDIAGSSWKELLEPLVRLPRRPHLIVSSRLADDYLWAEALNLGAYDVLAKPFCAEEVVRTVASAWRRWRRPEAVTRRPASPPRVAAAC